MKHKMSSSCAISGCANKFIDTVHASRHLKLKYKPPHTSGFVFYSTFQLTKCKSSFSFVYITAKSHHS